MAKTQSRPNPGQRSSGKRPAPRKRQPRPWYREYVWLPWILGLVVVGILVMALRSAGTDAPTTGAPVSSPVVGDDLHSLVVDPDDPDTLFIGSHQGVSISTDGAKTWEAVESLNGADAMGWGFTNDVIFMGGHPGLMVSTDGGKTFAARNDGLPATDVHALGAGDRVIYAGLAGAGTFASSDGGASWEVRSEEFGGAFMGRIQVDPADDEHLLAPDMQAGVMESRDGGRTWEPLGELQGVMWVSWDPTDTDRIVATTQGSASVSADGGTGWEPLEVPEGVSIVEFNPIDPEVLFAAVHDPPEAKVYLSQDGGATWNRP